jgi:glycosyltransferase involved in cell wall biosynthesis
VDLYIHDYVGHVGQTEVARALAERGHRVLFTYCHEMPTPRGGLTPDKGLESLQIEPIYVGRPINKDNYFKRQWTDILYGRALVRHLSDYTPQLVISANNPLMPQWALVRHCRRRGIPLIHWWTDIYSLAVRHGVGKRFGPLGRTISSGYQQLEIHLLNRAQGVLAIAEQFRTIAERWAIRSPVSVIPVAAPTEQVRPANKRNAWSIRQGVDTTLNILYCGTLANKHSPEFLLTLADRFRDRADVRVIVAAGGKGTDWLRREQEASPGANLILLPFQSFEDYPNVLASADVQVTILKPEAAEYSLPSKVMSQLCSARAQVAIVPPDNQGATLITAAKAGLVFGPDDFQAAAGAIEKLLADSEARRRHGENGRRYVEENLSLAVLAPQYEELFERVLRVVSEDAGGVR